MTNNNDNTYKLYAGKKLRELRLKTGLSIYKVAKKVHISGNYLSEIERGLKVPSNVVLQSLSNFYNIQNDELFKLYNKLTSDEIELYVRNPHLHKLITQVSVDERLSDNEKSIIYNELKKLYEKLLKENKESD